MRWLTLPIGLMTFKTRWWGNRCFWRLCSIIKCNSSPLIAIFLISIAQTDKCMWVMRTLTTSSNKMSSQLKHKKSSGVSSKPVTSITSLIWVREASLKSSLNRSYLKVNRTTSLCFHGSQVWSNLRIIWGRFHLESLLSIRSREASLYNQEADKVW